MDISVRQALEIDRHVDISTVGRKTGKLHKIEIAFHYLDGDIYISGAPGKRDWYANVVANPNFTFHFKQSLKADIPARATLIQDEETRKMVLPRIVAKWGRVKEIDSFIATSPLIRIDLQDVPEAE